MPRLLIALALMLSMAAAALWTAPADAQLLNYDSLVNSETQEATPAEDNPNRAPEVAVYGELTDDETYSADSLLQQTTQGVSVFRQRLQSTIARLPTAFGEMRTTLSDSSPTGEAGYFVGVFVVVVVLIMIGRAVAILPAIYVGRPLMVNAQKRDPTGYSGKLPVLAMRMAVTIGAIIITAAVAAAIGLTIFPEDHEPTQITAGVMLVGYSLFVLIDNIWRMVICPYLPDRRIPALTDRDARKLYQWMSVGAGFGIASESFCAWMEELGLAVEVHALVATALSLISVAIIISLIWVNRRAISRAILNGREPEDATWLASAGALIWAPLATLYFIAAWAVGAFRLVLGLEQGTPLLGGAFISLLVGFVIYAVFMFLVERYFENRRERDRLNAEAAARAQAEREAAARAEMGEVETSRVTPPLPDGAEIVTLEEYDGGAGDVDGDGDDEGGGPGPTLPREEAAPRPTSDRPGMRTFEDLARRVASLFALGVAMYILLAAWGGDAIFDDGSPFGIAEDVIDKILIGYILYHGVRIWMDQKIAEEGGDEIEEDEESFGNEGGGAAASRLATLLPLFRAFILVTIAVSVLLLVAVEFGVNVAPLFAGAGIVGLAIGFGAQTLVRDILSGMFFLLDDAFRKGEYIDVGEVKGTVEKISLRSFQLRHHLGALNTIPFGEITHLTNYSRDWVMMKLPLRLTYDTDVEKVRKIVKKLGQALLEHETEGHKFVQPLKSQGVYMMEDSAMIIRVKFMTRPGDQWTTRKLVYSKIRETFAEHGIKFAHKEVTVRIPDLPEGKTLSPEQQQAVGAAARRVGEEELATAVAADAR